ncbi:MAG: amidase [Vicinamibacteria bacterium]
MSDRDPLGEADRASFASQTSRRMFLGAAPAMAAAMGLPQASGAPPERVSEATLACAEELSGLAFTDEERELMLDAVNANRAHYEALRQVELPADTEPAFRFRPEIPAGAAETRQRQSFEAAPPSARPLPRVEVSVEPIENLAFQPVTALAPLVRERRISSTELTRMYLNRLKTHGTRLEAVVTMTEELGLAQAAEADREIAAGKYRGPLHGIPWGVKDLLATRGIRTTWGAKPYEHQVIDTDATVVERLRAAGAVLVAKLVTGELARGNLWFGGRTKNPWDPTRGAGGSSAGPAAAAAGGLVGFTIGTATGGSIVQPASVCGAVGLQPSYGRVSRHGVMTLAWTLDKAGPICRSVEDCMLVLEAIAGPDGRDETVVDVPVVWNPEASIDGLRIGYVARAFDDPPGRGDDDGVRRERKAVLDAALQQFRELAGRPLEPVALPALPAQAIFAIVLAEGGASFGELVQSGAAGELTGQGPGSQASYLRAAQFIPAVEYLRAQRVRRLLVREMNALFSRYDALLLPHDLEMVRMTNLSGHPCISVKAGFVNRLPEAVLVAGPLHDEGMVAQVARAYERATEWNDRQPPMA